MVYSKKWYHLLAVLIFIVILISLSFLHELQDRRKLFSQQLVAVDVPLPVLSPRCEVTTRHFYFTVDSCETFITGERLEIIGRVELDSDEAYLKQKRLIVEDISVHKLQLTSPKDWSGILEHKIRLARAEIYQHIRDAVPPYQAGLVLAIVFGTTEWLAGDIQPHFEITGTLHILAASGQNISLLLMMVEPLIPHSTPIRIKGAILVLVSITYLIVVGLQPSLVRATFMAVILLISRYFFYHQYSALYSLFLSTVLILIVRPEWMFAIGFLLSVCATLGIICLLPLFKDAISRVGSASYFFRALNSQNTQNTISSYLIDSSLTELSAQVATFPILYTQIGTVQLFSFFPTTMVSWLLPILMTGTFVLLIVSFLTEGIPLLNIVSKVVSIILVWLPTDVFIYLLAFLARYEWGELTNSWLK